MHTDRVFSVEIGTVSFFLGGRPGFRFFNGDFPSIFLGFVPFLLDFVTTVDFSTVFSSFVELFS